MYVSHVNKGKFLFFNLFNLRSSKQSLELLLCRFATKITLIHEPLLRIYPELLCSL